MAAFIPSSDSVVAFQSNPSSLLVGASIIGSVPVRPNPASVYVVNPVSTITVTAPANQSVSGTVQAELLSTNASIITVGGTSGNSSVLVLNITGAAALSDSDAANPTTGTIGAFMMAANAGASAANRVRAMGDGLNSTGTGLLGAGMIAQYDDTSPTAITENRFGNVRMSSIRQLLVSLDEVSGRSSIVAMQGTSPWVVNVPTPSYLSIQPAGSVLAVRTDSASVVAVLSNSSVATLQGTSPWLITGSVAAIVNNSIGSIVGTYAEDAAHTTNDKGLFTLGVRNDAVASLVSADLEYIGTGLDSAGRVVIKPFAPEESRFQFQTSVVSGSVTLIAPSVTGKRQYITDFWLVNSGSVATLITWKDGSTSILGYAVAPSGTGANSPGIHMPIRTNPSQDLVFNQAPSASILYVTVNGYTAP